MKVFWATASECWLSAFGRAHAEELHRGFLVDAAIGAGLSLGDYSSSDPARRYQNVAGPALSVAITPAYAWSVFALGVVFDGTDVQSARRDFGSRDALLLSASATAMLTPSRPGVDTSLSFGVAAAALTGFITQDGTELDSESAFGPRVAGRMGYRFSNGLGLATTASYAYLTNDLVTYEPLVLAMVLTYVGWGHE